MLSRITVAICESMAGVGGKRRLLSGGTGFLAISGIIFVFLVFNIWRDYVMSHFSLLQSVLSGIEGEIFTCHQDDLWIGNWGLDFELLSWFLRFRIWYEFIKILRCINPAMLCLVMHSAGEILVWLSCRMSRGDICCTEEHDRDDPFYVREFHISMRHYVY